MSAAMWISNGRNTPDWSDAVIERGTQGERRVYRIWRLNVPLNKESKQAVVAEVGAQVAKRETVGVAWYRGIPGGDRSRLRANARERQVSLRVFKNPLAPPADE